MKVIGITGGIASGKSTVSSILERLGAHIIDADKISRGVSSGAALPAIRAAFGGGVFDGYQLNRRALAALVFADKDELTKLENIIHPLVTSEIQQVIETNKGTNKVVIIDAPLLIETGEGGLIRLIDELWVTYVPECAQLDRLMKRDGLTAQEARLRVSAQTPFSYKARHADAIIPMTLAIPRVEEIVKRLYDRIAS